MSLKKLCLHVLSSGSHLSNTKHPACSACHRILVPSTTCLKHSETHFVITYLRLKLKVMGKATFFGGNSEKNSRDSTLLHSLIVRDHAPCNTAMYSGSKTTTNIYKDGCHRYFTRGPCSMIFWKLWFSCREAKQHVMTEEHSI